MASLAIPEIKVGDWNSVRVAFQKLKSLRLGTNAIPTFAGLTITDACVLGSNSAVFQPATDSTTFFQILDANGGTPIFNVDSTNEKVGIGTVNPTQKLHIKSTTSGVGLKLDRAANTNEALLHFATGGATDWFVGLDNSPVKDDFQIKTTNNAVPKFIIKTSGNVGIGLTVPKTKLTVEGTLTLKEQAVADGDTADYGQIWVKDDTPCSLYLT